MQKLYLKLGLSSTEYVEFQIYRRLNVDDLIFLVFWYGR